MDDIPFWQMKNYAHLMMIQNLLDDVPDYDINLIGYPGTITKTFLGKFATDMAKNNFKGINKVNIYFREKNYFSQEKNLKYNVDSTKFKMNLSMIINSGLSANESAQKYVSDNFDKKFNFNPIRHISDLSKIVDDSKKIKGRAITLVSSRYDYSYLFDGERKLSVDEILNKIKQTHLSSKKKIELNNSEVLNYLLFELKTNFADFPHDALYKDLNIIGDIQEKRLNNEKALDEFKQDRNIKTKSRLDMLVDNLIGVSELGKTQRGYEGIDMIIANDSDYTTHNFLASSDIPANKVFAPTRNDYERLKVLIYEAFREHKGPTEELTIRVPIPLGKHGGKLAIDFSKIKFGGRSWDETFGIQSRYYADKIRKQVEDWGLDWANATGEVAEDTAHALFADIVSIIGEKEESDYVTRGSVFNPEKKMVITGVLKFKDGLIEQVFDENTDPGNLKEYAQKEYNSNINEQKDLMKLFKKYGSIKYYEFKLAKPLEKYVCKVKNKDPLVPIFEGIRTGKIILADEKKEYYEYLVTTNPVGNRSLLAYELSGDNLEPEHIIFDDVDKTTSISTLKVSNNKIKLLLKKKNTGSSDYLNKFFEISYNNGSFEKKIVAEFNHLGIADFDFFEDRLFYCTGSNDERGIRMKNLISNEMEIYKSDEGNNVFYEVHLLANGTIGAIIGRAEEDLRIWAEGNNKYSQSVHKGFIDNGLKINNINSHHSISVFDSGISKIYSYPNNSENVIERKIDSNKMGIRAENGTVCLAYVLNDKLIIEEGTNLKSFQGNSNMRKTKISKAIKKDVGENFSDLLITKKNILLIGENGYGIFEKENLEYTGKVVSGYSETYGIIQKY